MRWARSTNPNLCSWTLQRTLPLECQWILSRLDVAVRECTRGFSEGSYDFALSTNAAYRFWLYELCDVYLELTKPAIQAGGEKKLIVQNVLLYAVEVALRLLHPMMPFLTEELWHRLPNYESFGVQSIMLAPYPEVCGYENSAVEEQMKMLMDTVHVVRSTKAFYSLTNKHRPDVWVTVRTADARDIVEAQKFMIESLGVVGKVTVISAEEEASLPKGCGFAVVSKDLSINMMLLGFIDVQKEVAKLEKQAAGVQKQLDGLRKKVSVPDYEAKVPADVREANKVKLESLIEQEKQLVEGIAKMKSLL
uniref:valine--tRNA ligase n=1 Tax=Trypanosoma congolense (strain IL3000) TaxID=1068625 RepID=G0UP26_TRYCI|nr:unnamed protein product [Trypanosoma congolense IL3000]